MAETDTRSYCPSCKQMVDPRFAFCPHCREALSARCPNAMCGRIMPDDWKFCPTCGTEPAAPGPTCEACAQPVNPAWRFCAKCGHRLFVACASCGGAIQESWAHCVHCGRRLGDLTSPLDRQRALRTAEQLQEGQKENEADRLNDRGAELLDQERFEEALEEFRVAYELQPDATFMGNMGLAYQGMGEHGQALRCFEEAARLDPYSPTPHLNLGYLYTDMERLEDAASSFRRAVKLDPDGAEGQEAREALENLKNL